MFRKINNWLHLWLGLISGIIMLIVCLTGAIWVFGDEIKAFITPPVKVAYQNKPILSPSQITKIAGSLYPGRPLAYLDYQKNKAVEVAVGDWGKDTKLLFLDPYTGKILGERLMEDQTTLFFYFIESGHRFLWMPWKIGRAVVNYGTLMFVFLLITGLVWWYPKKWTKSTREKSFKIKWSANWKRVNIDLHNVFGFYAVLILLALSLSGMVYGIKWYSAGLYWSTSGGETLPEWEAKVSDTTLVDPVFHLEQALDKALVSIVKHYPDAEGYYLRIPDRKDFKASISVSIYPHIGQTYANETVYFDRHNGQEIEQKAFDRLSYRDASFGLKLRRMNYDIHVGQILGLPGKILAFFASVIGATLPVTGFIIWYNRKFGKKKKKAGVKIKKGA